MPAKAKMPAKDNDIDDEIVILDTNQMLHHPPKAYPNHNLSETQLNTKLINENEGNNNNGDDDQKDDVVLILVVFAK